jgi:hypothetical protein
MSILREILHNFLLNVFFFGGGFWIAEECALAAGAPPVPGDLAGIAVGAVASVLAYRSVHEPLLRHITGRPHMTPEDYRHLREMEIELGWEPSEMPTPVERSSREAATPVTPAPPRYCTCAEPSLVEVRVPESATSVASYCAACGRATGTLTATGTVTLSGTAALSGSGTLSAKATWDDVAYPSEAAQHFAQLARVGREYCPSYCPICADRDSRRVTRSFADVKADGKATERRIKDEAKAVARLAEDIATVKRSIEKMQREQP